MGSPTLIFCAGNNKEFVKIAIESGYRYGARLPGVVHHQLYFADQDWKNPDRTIYMNLLEKHRPEICTVLDMDSFAAVTEAFSWAEEASAIVSRIVMIPKLSGIIGDIPERIGRAEIILGYSVPTSYGGTDVPLWEFGRRPVHLLGGSPQKQLRLADYLNVFSADGNMMLQQANRCRFWSRRPFGPKSLRWVQLRDIGDCRTTGANAESFRLSCVNIMQAWQSKFPQH